MPGLSLTIVLKGAEKLANTLKNKDTIKKPMANGIRRTTLEYDRLVKQATVVDTGRLRSSITNQISPDIGRVGTNVMYASFVEYGTGKMEARHMAQGRKILGKGMFAYALELLSKWLSRDKHGINKDIEAKFD